jgi:hypothetical protein
MKLVEISLIRRTTSTRSLLIHRRDYLRDDYSQDETSEMFIGEWMEKRGNREQMVVATKVSALPPSFLMLSAHFACSTRPISSVDVPTSLSMFRMLEITTSHSMLVSKPVSRNFEPRTSTYCTSIGGITRRVLKK